MSYALFIFFFSMSKERYVNSQKNFKQGKVEYAYNTIVLLGMAEVKWFIEQAVISPIVPFNEVHALVQQSLVS